MARLILTILIVPLICALGNAQSSGNLRGRVSGTVFDANGSVVLNVKVVFDSAGLKREALTNDEGYYGIELPAGVYRVTAHNAGFCPYQRAPFRLQPSAETLLDLTLTVCPIANLLHYDKAGNYVGEECRYIDPLASETFAIKGLSNAPRDLLVRYGRRKEQGEVVQYERAKIENGIPEGVTVSYDVLTIVADRVTFNKQTFRLEAEGNVKVQDGKQRLGFKSIALDLKAKVPIATLKGIEY